MFVSHVATVWRESPFVGFSSSWRLLRYGSKFAGSIFLPFSPIFFLFVCSLATFLGKIPWFWSLPMAILECVDRFEVGILREVRVCDRCFLKPKRPGPWAHGLFVWFDLSLFARSSWLVAGMDYWHPRNADAWFFEIFCRLASWFGMRKKPSKLKRLKPSEKYQLRCRTMYQPFLSGSSKNAALHLVFARSLKFVSGWDPSRMRGTGRTGP